MIFTESIQHEGFLQSMPIASQEPLGDAVKHYFGGGEAAMNFHERLADLLLMQLSFSMEEPGWPSTKTSPLHIFLGTEKKHCEQDGAHPCSSAYHLHQYHGQY